MRRDLGCHLVLRVSVKDRGRRGTVFSRKYGRELGEEPTTQKGRTDKHEGKNGLLMWILPPSQSTPGEGETVTEMSFGGMETS